MTFPFPAFIYPGVAKTAWNPSDKGANITLSTGDRANSDAAGSGSAWNSVRTTSSFNSGKRYFEIYIVSTVDGNNMPGLMTSGASLANFPGGTASGAGINPSQTFVNGFTSTTPATMTLTTGDVAGIAVDFAAGKAWVRKNGTWAGAGDPTSAAWVSFTAGTTLFAAFASFNGDKGRFIGKSFFYNPPAGFSPWDS